MFYLFHGDNVGETRERLLSLLGQYDHPPQVISATELSESDLDTLFATIPMFSDKFLYVIEGSPKKNAVSTWQQILEKNLSHIDCAFVVTEQLKSGDPLLNLAHYLKGKVWLSRKAGSPKVFTFLDLVASRQKIQSQKELSLLLSEGEDPYAVFSLLLWQFRNLVFVASTNKSSRKLHPFVHKKIQHQLKNWRWAELVAALNSLLECDRLIKSGKLGKKLAVWQLTLNL